MKSDQKAILDLARQSDLEEVRSAIQLAVWWEVHSLVGLEAVSAVRFGVRSTVGDSVDDAVRSAIGGVNRTMK